LNINHLDVVTSFHTPEVDDADINMTQAESWWHSLNAPTIVVSLRNALYGLKQAPQLWHADIYTFLLSLKFTQSLANPTLYLRRDGNPMLL